MSNGWSRSVSMWEAEPPPEETEYGVTHQEMLRDFGFDDEEEDDE